MHAARVDNLIKEFRSRKKLVRALDGIDLEIAQGEVFGLLGPNGAGKTTLTRCILGLSRPTSGSVTLFGKSPRNPSSRASVGFVPEIVHFPGFLTAPEVMAFHARLAGADPSPIPKLLEEAGLGSAQQRVGQFSKGMLRRLSLAQALLGEPRLLVLDEPTADLDPVGRLEVRERLLAARDSGATIVLNSHLLSEVERVCSKVGILHEGRLLTAGSIAEVAPEGRSLEEVFVELVRAQS